MEKQVEQDYLSEHYKYQFLESLDKRNEVLDFQEFQLNSLENNLSEITLFRINELTFDENEKNPRREAFENVLGTLRLDGINFIYLILGNSKGVSFYFGIAKNLKEDQELVMNIQEIGDSLLKSGIQGNFRGSKITKLSPKENREILQRIKNSKRFGTVTGIPGINESEDRNNFQGIDRLTDVMLGDEFGLCILAKPVDNFKIHTLEKQLYSVYDRLSVFSKNNIQSGVNTSKSTGESKGTNSSTTEAEGKTKGTSENKSVNISTAKSTSFSRSTGTSESKSKGTNVGTNVTDTESNSSGTSSSSSNSSKSKSKATGQSEGTSKTETIGSSTNESETTGTNESESQGKSIGISDSISNTQSKTFGENVSTTSNESQGTSYTVSVEVQNREVQEWLKYIDDILLPTIDYGKSKGIYYVSSFIFSNNNATLIKLGNTMTSLFSGRTGNKTPLNLELLTDDDVRIPFLQNFQIPEYDISTYNTEKRDALLLKSQMYDYSVAEYGNWYSVNELSLMAGLPQKEVVGLSLKEETEFGLNVTSCCQEEIKEEEKITLGNLVQSGNELNISVPLDKKALNKHIFVTGVTGTGKTTTCQKLLLESEMPFLVVEPAKTEYRILIDEEKTKDILIFTLGKDTVSPFRLNPFEFFEHESISSRVDMLKAAMEASFDMEAAIPQLLESSMYECYKDYGWDIQTNKNNKFENPFAKGVYSFPTLQDLLEKVEVEVTKQGFDERLKRDYIGSIKARLQGLLIGAKGIMLNVGRGIDFRELIEKKVVLEIEEIKNGSEKSLIMGFVLTNLCEALKAKYRENRMFKHITLIEEAHRLLAKLTAGDSPNKKQGIETFTDMLAEVRKYGESLIIADQIPNKLTPEVLKNTNTKIVHKLFAEDDKEAIGTTMSLSQEQKNFLSSLGTGRAIVFSQGWEKALQVQIKRTTNTTGERYVEDYELTDRIIDFYQQNNIILGLQYLERKATEEEFEYCKKITSYQKEVKLFKHVFENDVDNFEQFKEIFELLLDKTLWKGMKVALSGEYGDPKLLSEKEKIYFVNQIKKIGNSQDICNIKRFIALIEMKYYIGIDMREECYTELLEDVETLLNNIMSLTDVTSSKIYINVRRNKIKNIKK